MSWPEAFWRGALVHEFRYIIKGRPTFEAKIEGGKANSFKSPVEAEHSAADRKLTMTARLRRGRLIGSRARVARYPIKSRISDLERKPRKRLGVGMPAARQ